MGHTFNRPDEAAMLRILERHPHSPEGAILRLAWLEGLSRSEITELRWDQVDFEGKAIQLPDRAVPLEPSTEACLRERHVRCALRDPHVVISERSKKAYAAGVHFPAVPAGAGQRGTEGQPHGPAPRFCDPPASDP